MKKILPGIYIHFLTVALFSVCYITGKLETLFITYLILFLHESAHLLAAKSIGLKISHISFLPFGVNLKLKNKMVYSLTDEVILYISGPLSNILMAVFAKIFFRNYFWYEDFYLKNIILCIINLLPILPLDGGVILKKIIASKTGYSQSIRAMKFLSVIMIISGIALLYKSDMLRYNFSFYFFLTFLMGNIFTTKEKYNVDILKSLMFADKKINLRKTRVLVAHYDENLRNILKDFTNTHYNLLCIIGENGEIKKIMSEREVFDTLMAN